MSDQVDRGKDHAYHIPKGGSDRELRNDHVPARDLAVHPRPACPPECGVRQREGERAQAEIERTDGRCQPVGDLGSSHEGWRSEVADFGELWSMCD